MPSCNRCHGFVETITCIMLWRPMVLVKYPLHILLVYCADCSQPKVASHRERYETQFFFNYLLLLLELPDDLLLLPP